MGTLRRDEKFILLWWGRFLVLALDLLNAPPSQIEKRCIDSLGADKCSVERNHYMRVALHELLGGDSAADHAKESPHSGVAWLLLGFIILVAVLWRQLTTSGRKQAISTASSAAAPSAPGSGRKGAARQRRTR